MVSRSDFSGGFQICSQIFDTVSCCKDINVYGSPLKNINEPRRNINFTILYSLVFLETKAKWQINLLRNNPFTPA